MFRLWSHSRSLPENDKVLAQTKVTELRNALGPLCDRSLKYCRDACFWRYLYARNWNIDKSKKMLQETLKWRADYKPEEIRWVSWEVCYMLWRNMPVHDFCTQEFIIKPSSTLYDSLLIFIIVVTMLVYYYNFTNNLDF